MKLKKETLDYLKDILVNELEYLLDTGQDEQYEKVAEIINQINKIEVE